MRGEQRGISFPQPAIRPRAGKRGIKNTITGKKEDQPFG
jgi:hypothetical protein